MDLYCDLEKLSELDCTSYFKWYHLYEWEEEDRCKSTKSKVCFDSNYQPRQLNPGILDHDAIELFMHGQCHALAYVLNRGQGDMDLYQIKHKSIVHFHHYLCKDRKTGFFVDITGARTLAEYKCDLLNSDDNFTLDLLKSDLVIKKTTDKPVIWFAITLIDKVLYYISQRKIKPCFNRSKVDYFFSY